MGLRDTVRGKMPAPVLRAWRRAVAGARELKVAREFLRFRAVHGRSGQVAARADLAFFVRPVPRARVAEIGVYAGEYTDAYFPRLRRDAELWLIDIWDTEGNDPLYAAMADGLQAGYRRVQRRFGSRPNCHMVRKRSDVAAADFDNESFDWVYIDADHRYEAIRSDIVAWYPKVRMGGIISGHDFVDSAHPRFRQTAYDFGVCKAVEELFAGEYALTPRDSHPSWWLRKTRPTLEQAAAQARHAPDTGEIPLARGRQAC